MKKYKVSVIVTWSTELEAPDKEYAMERAREIYAMAQEMYPPEFIIREL